MESLSVEQFSLFRELIYKHSGIRIEATKITLVTNRLRRRLKALQLTDFDTYYKLLTSRKGATELGAFLDAITTNETSFFRTPQHFDWFRDTFIPGMISRAVNGEHPRAIRAWSAACSTGEEPYSIGICLREQQLRLRGWQLTIMGTDISEEALQTARSGVYRAKIAGEMTAKCLQRNFDPSPAGDSYAIRDNIKQLVEFRQHNLMQPLRVEPFDCIFIRNVLIYFDRASKETVIHNLRQVLAPKGFLVVGPSEGIFDMLQPLVKRETFLYQNL
jgi:chemotaxis protein methyltransferase CheR